MKRILYLFVFLPLISFSQGVVVQQHPVTTSGGNFNHQVFQWSNGSFINTFSIPFGSTATWNNAIFRTGALFYRTVDSSLLIGQADGSFIPIKGGGSSSNFYMDGNYFLNDGSTPTLAVKWNPTINMENDQHFTPNGHAMIFGTSSFLSFSDIVFSANTSANSLAFGAKTIAATHNGDTTLHIIPTDTAVYFKHNVYWIDTARVRKRPTNPYDVLRLQDQGNVQSSNAVISGGVTTIIGTNTLAVGPVTYRVNNIILTKASSTFFTLNPSTGGLSHYEAVYGDASGVLSRTIGIANAAPTFPPIPANTVLIGYALVTPGGAIAVGVTSPNIYNKTDSLTANRTVFFSTHQLQMGDTLSQKSYLKIDPVNNILQATTFDPISSQVLILGPSQASFQSQDTSQNTGSLNLSPTSSTFSQSRLSGQLVFVLSLDEQNNSASFVSPYNHRGIEYSKVDTANYGDSTLVTKRWVINRIAAGASGVTSFNTRTGAVTLNSSDVTTALGFTPVTNARTVAGFALSSDVTLSSHTVGYGLSGSAYNGSAAQAWTADTTSSTGLVSKSRLATNLGGYVPATRTVAGFSLSGNVTLATETYGTGLVAGSYNGSTAATAKVDTTAIQTIANFFPKGDTRYLKSSTVSGLANPTGTIGFTAVNGTATTVMRSDGAPKADSTLIRSVANSMSLSTLQTKFNLYAPLAGTNSFTGINTFLDNGIATTPTDEVIVQNTTAAAVGAQQYSPAISLKGNGWGTTAGTSQTIAWRQYVIPIQGATASGSLTYDVSLNGGAYATKLQLASSGTMTVGGGTGSVNAGQYTGNVSSIGTTSTDAIVTANSTASTAGVPVQYSGRLRLHGTVWNTTATAANNLADWGMEVRPVSGTTPTSNLYFMSSLVTSGSPSFTDIMNIKSDGTTTHYGSVVPNADNTLNLGSTTLTWANAYFKTVNANGTLAMRGDAGITFFTNGGTKYGQMFNTTGDFLLQNAGVFTDNTTYRFQVGGRILAGLAGTTLGTYDLSGNTSGTITIKPQAAAGTYEFDMPITAGTAGQVLTSQGGAGTAMAWSSVPIVQGSADLTAQSAAGNVTTFTVGASTATFNVSQYINVTAVSVDVIQGQITYTDENNTSQTVSLSNISAIGNSTYSPVTIRAKNGTVITVKTNLTTGAGSILFDAGGRITQL